MLEVVEARDDILQGKEFGLLIELEEDDFLMKVLDIFFPILKLLTHDARGVTRWRGIGEPLNL